MKTIDSRLKLMVVCAVWFAANPALADPPTVEAPLYKNAAEIPANFRRENLLAWCIVPFDVKERSPEARTEMLVDLGMTRCAYDWRQKHVPTFESEIVAYQQNGVAFSAFWGEHEEAFRLFRKHGIRPQVWQMVPQPKAATQGAKVAEAAASMLPLAQQCNRMGRQLGLYNHGGWAGEPANIVAVCDALAALGYPDVGIIYNFHHAHELIADASSVDRFAKSLKLLQPRLICLNLNGMVDLQQFQGRPEKQREMKIRPIGSGDYEAAMIRVVLDAGYEGPIGVLGHVKTRDAKFVLRENVEGLEYLLGSRAKPDWLAKLKEAEYLAKWTPKARDDSKLAYEREKDPDWDDDRPAEMDTGQTFCHSINVPISASDGKDRTKLFAKAIAVKGNTIKGGSAVKGSANSTHLLFDTQQLNIASAWTGDFIKIPPQRFGILKMPSIGSAPLWSEDRDLRWQVADEDGKFSPVSKNDIRFRGFHRLDQHETEFVYTVAGTNIRDFIWCETKPNDLRIQRRLRRTRATKTLRLPLCYIDDLKSVQSLQLPEDDESKYNLLIKCRNGTAVHAYSDLTLRVKDDTLFAILPATEENAPETAQENVVFFSIHRVELEQPRVPEFAPSVANKTNRPESYAKNQWSQPLRPKLKNKPDATPPERDETAAAFVVDTIPVPLTNRFKALMFTSGFDFVDEHRAFVCTVHGDVWLVSGLDDSLENVTWKRYATGLYQPLGLKVVDGLPIVMCRDRLTRLHDKNGDNEADFYENFNDDLHVTGQSHAYAMSLETDPAGNFYFIKSGGSAPHGGTMLKLSADGKDLSVHATGYRHGNGLGVSPTGVVTSADNEGNWVPKTRIDWVKPGGFYGHMPTHRRETKPETYDPPLLWMPRSIDNSAGGQTWVPTKGQEDTAWAVLAGKMIHFSFGRCTANVVLPQKVGDVRQAAIYRLDILAFKSGSMRGRFNPADGHLYVCGLDGWQTAAVQDGHFQRIRATGKPFYQPTDFAAFKDRLEITFDQPLDRASAEALSNWKIQQWNYRWSSEYGSDHYSVADPEKVGHDDVPISRIQLSSDAKVVTVFVNDLQPVMQMNIRGDVKAADGYAVGVDLFNTIHALE